MVAYLRETDIDVNEFLIGNLPNKCFIFQYFSLFTLIDEQITVTSYTSLFHPYGGIISNCNCNLFTLKT